MNFNKRLIVSYIVMLATLCSCGGKDHLSTTVNDNNGKLTIKVDADKKWEPVHYNKTFDIRGMTKSQRDSIVHHVFDSLQLGINESKN